jgi:hypothetical protein
MQPFTVFLDEMQDTNRPESAPTYQVAVAPFSQNSSSTMAMGTRRYSSREHFIHDLRTRLGCTDGAITRFFADPNKYSVWVNHPLSVENAAYFGW